MEKDKDKNIILYMLKVNDKLGPASAHLDTSCLAYNIRKNYQGRDKKKDIGIILYMLVVNLKLNICLVCKMRKKQKAKIKIGTSFSTFGPASNCQSS